VHVDEAHQHREGAEQQRHRLRADERDDIAGAIAAHLSANDARAAGEAFLRRPSVFGERDAPALELAVEDTGSGIKPTEMPRIFDLYFTTKDGGSGIGLSMVYRTVQMHDGDIEVQSTVGTGTTFRILLPQT